MSWNERYLEGDTPWDKGAPHPALESLVRRPDFRGRVLVPGCGTGQDARFLASVGVAVTGCDLAPAALRLAREADPLRIVEWVEADFLDPASAPGASFDWIVEHTLFCAIHPQERESYRDACLQVLRPGGYLFGIFFTHLERISGPPWATSEAEIGALFGAGFALQNFGHPERTHDGREGEETVWLMRRR